MPIAKAEIPQAARSRWTGAERFRGAPADAVSVDAERTARGDKPTKNAGTPMIIFPILALGLAAVGTLSRVVMKIAAARRARTIIDHPDPDREKRP